tara:strand:+ start:6173 stop:6304 length:132 start_codon:yes stop_codon:yes gene_type:complete
MAFEMMLAAEPGHIEGFAVVFVVGFRWGVAARLAWLSVEFSRA